MTKIIQSYIDTIHKINKALTNITINPIKRDFNPSDYDLPNIPTINMSYLQREKIAVHLLQKRLKQEEDLIDIKVNSTTFLDQTENTGCNYRFTLTFPQAKQTEPYFENKIYSKVNQLVSEFYFICNTITTIYFKYE